VTNVDANENMPEKQAEVAVTRDPQYQQAEKIQRHKSNQMSFGYVACSASALCLGFSNCGSS
jgi:hypothetical protein